MILDAVFNLAFSLLSGAINLLPFSTGFPSEGIDAILYVAGFIGIWDPLVPLSTLATVVGIVFSVEIGIFVFKTSKWVWSHMPYIGGKG